MERIDLIKFILIFKYFKYLKEKSAFIQPVIIQLDVTPPFFQLEHHQQSFENYFSNHKKELDISKFWKMRSNPIQSDSQISILDLSSEALSHMITSTPEKCKFY